MSALLSQEQNGNLQIASMTLIVFYKLQTIPLGRAGGTRSGRGRERAKLTLLTGRGRGRVGAFENADADADAVDSNASSRVLDVMLFL